MILNLIFATGGMGGETCRINGNRVLLYKVINWWYDCLVREYTQLCGLPVKCRSKGDTRVEYNGEDKRLILRIHGGFAGGLSLFKTCPDRFGPAFLEATWLNPTFFGRGKALSVSNQGFGLDSFVMENIDEIHARRLQEIEDALLFEVDGVAGGLLDGRIALHPSGDFLKTCPKEAGDSIHNFPISVRIINSASQTVLAIYTAVWR